MPERDYSHRDVLDKLGIQPGHAVALEDGAWPVEDDLRRRVFERADPNAEEPFDVVLLTADDPVEVEGALRRWRPRIVSAGGIWVLTRKRGHPGYVDQRQLIPAGAAAGLVDNKSCSVADTVSGMRFVIRRADRGRP